MYPMSQELEEVSHSQRENLPLSRRHRDKILLGEDFSPYFNQTLYKESRVF